MLRHTGLRENTRGSLRGAICAAAFGEEEVRRTVASTGGVSSTHHVWEEKTYKKNLDSPQQTALKSASLSDAFLGIGLQNASGSSRFRTVR